MSGIRVCFHGKHENIAGLQLADLVAWPIGHKYLHPGHGSRAFEVVESKFRKGPEGQVLGYGLKIFPA